MQALVWHRYRFNDFINYIAEPQRSNTKDSYFIELACSHILANMLFFIATASQEEVNIYNFASFFTSNSVPEKTERLSKFVADGFIASINFKGILTNKWGEKTFTNVSSYVSAMLNPFIIRKSLYQVLSQCSFDVRGIGSSKVLDEFCNIPAIPDMPSMISAARSRNMRFFFLHRVCVN